MCGHLSKSQNMHKTSCTVLRPTEKNKCVSGNGTENFKYGRHTYLFFLLFLGDKYNFMHFERRNAFLNA